MCSTKANLTQGQKEYYTQRIYDTKARHGDTKKHKFGENGQNGTHDRINGMFRGNSYLKVSLYSCAKVGLKFLVPCCLDISRQHNV